MLKILIVHNHYQQRGGEDAVFEAEVALLRAHGVSVETLTVHNDAISGLAAQIGAAGRAIWNRQAADRVRDAIRAFRPDVLHAHNTFPQLSPSIFVAAQQMGVATVWTLHNYRIGCASGVLLRDGEICEDCVGRLPLPAIRHRCYRGSLAGSAAAAAVIASHQAFGTWRHRVDRFIALSEFTKTKFVEMGLPVEKISVKPNFLSKIEPLKNVKEHRKYGLFVGRLSPEKGVHTLMEAWSTLEFPLKMIGDGPLMNALAGSVVNNQKIELLGRLDTTLVHQHLQSAAFLVVPSVCYESFGLVALEAMANSVPVIASRIGGLAELVVDQESGLLFTPGDPNELANAVNRLIGNPELQSFLGSNGRKTFEALYGPDRNLDLLMDIYASAIAARKRAQTRRVRS